jgi:hypothetical protein
MTFHLGDIVAERDARHPEHYGRVIAACAADGVVDVEFFTEPCTTHWELCDFLTLVAPR